MMPTIRSPFALVLVLLLTACGAGSSSDSSTVFRHFSFDAGAVVVHANGVADATVTAAGEMSVAGKAVETTAAQRTLLAHYHASVLKLRTDGVAIGKAGIKTAGKAIGSVVSGLASGNPDTIGDKIDAQAQEIESRVGDLCETLHDLRSTQEAIAAEMPAFRPYATITARESDHCR